MATDPEPSRLSPEALHLLDHVLDAIIPPADDGPQPGAGALGLAEILQRTQPAAVPALAEGLAALREHMAERVLPDFSALPAEEQRALLEQTGQEQPRFLPALLFQTYTTYYQQPAVLEALGLEGRPPYPLGYTLETGDLDLLEPVRERPPLYRRA